MVLMYFSSCFSTGKEPDLNKVPGITSKVQPELHGLETSVKMGLDLEYEKDGRWLEYRRKDLVDSAYFISYLMCIYFVFSFESSDGNNIQK